MVGDERGQAGDTHARLPVTPPLTHTSRPTLRLRPQADRGAVVITLLSLLSWHGDPIIMSPKLHDLRNSYTGPV